MRKPKIISCILVVVSILMVLVGFVLQKQNVFGSNSNPKYSESDINNMAYSGVLIMNENYSPRMDETVTAIEMEVAPASVIIPPRVEVYDGLTLEELAAKLDRNLGNDYIAGKGMLLASQCIEKGVDPYVAVAIILHETGCGSKCSNLARACNNVGGQKGSPGCNGGSFKRYETLDAGIIGFIDNLSKNYYGKGLVTVEAIGAKYCEGNTWPGKINSLVAKIKNS